MFTNYRVVVVSNILSAIENIVRYSTIQIVSDDDDDDVQSRQKDADYNVRTRYGRQRRQHIDERPRCSHVSVNEIIDFFLCTYNFFVCLFVRNDDDAIENIDYNYFYYN